MKKRGDKRVQLKRLKFQIKQAFNSQKDPFHFLEILKKLEPDIQVEKSHTYPYHLILDVEINYPDYRQTNKTNPRYIIYKLRYYFDSVVHATSPTAG